jgi:hypothetical protein
VPDPLQGELLYPAFSGSDSAPPALGPCWTSPSTTASLVFFLFSIFYYGDLKEIRFRKALEQIEKLNKFQIETNLEFAQKLKLNKFQRTNYEF